MLVWLGETFRPTRDADLLGYGELENDSLARIFREVCGVEVESDAVTFDADSVAVAPIRENDSYGGRRVTVNGLLGAARLRVQVDIGIGDAVTPEPQWMDYPGLLDLPRPRLRAYPRETVLAEKLHAMVLLGMRNSRMKDYFDVHALLREDAMDRHALANAIGATFARRQTALPEGVPVGLSDAFAIDRAKFAQWHAFLGRNRLSAPDLKDVVENIRDRIAAPLELARASQGSA